MPFILLRLGVFIVIFVWIMDKFSIQIRTSKYFNTAPGPLGFVV
ncbi:hypothetical protein C427_3934 [Paraglaciecola psychrophila 170]|uniref:Uncharacterized protein n=1 Tax=Paraglaciecola psychrophila 170 TaxID=1129794 RepID=K7AQZ4_9ALTE|nr:hypothetical protein C427_3934 [Paraglaciecola psychrophila 170]GAC37715.1 hypothetical protein GPSY_2093 [Paraglaciecola psychrophila 170]